MRDDNFIAGCIAFVAVMAFSVAAFAMALDGYWFSPCLFAVTLPLVVRSIWRDRKERAPAGEKL